MATKAAAGVREMTFSWEGKDRSGKIVRGEMRAQGDAVVFLMTGDAWAGGLVLSYQAAKISGPLVVTLIDGDGGGPNEGSTPGGRGAEPAHSAVRLPLSPPLPAGDDAVRRRRAAAARCRGAHRRLPPV